MGGRRSSRKITQPSPNPIDEASDSSVGCSGYRSDGAVAQLGERLTGSQEVAGSIPASSTFLYGRVASEIASAPTAVPIPLRHATAACRARSAATKLVLS